MTLKRINHSELGEPAGPYVHAVKHRDTLYLSGLTAYGTEAYKASIGHQASAIFRQIEAVANAEGCGLEQLIKVTIFVTELENLGELRKTLFAVYGAHLPASSLVKVDSLFDPELLIEVEATLAI
ncbi:enamine deaminase RidA [Hahella sp. CCB-MM4]|uniref:RidA family protein n=1 Tax=Hahella sp. (strain CCB-MM4) TaxID=1926491 RepID=UPI000B9B028E|nr:RidA family protein [Hahella sp. CCB-MM4]OZG70776.1 enamine deaminase RidA [Hahella sp. CCB-MM4]